MDRESLGVKFHIKRAEQTELFLCRRQGVHEPSCQPSRCSARHGIVGCATHLDRSGKEEEEENFCEWKGLGGVNPLIPGMGSRQGWNRIGSWKTRRSLQDRWMDACWVRVWTAQWDLAEGKSLHRMRVEKAANKMDSNI